jgi:ligand-binding sensor domain-containing protein
MRRAHLNIAFYARMLSIFFILLLKISSAFCQLSFSSRKTTSLRFEHIGIEDGLSNENVTYIFQDSKGYIWFGTFDGLNKYDGYSFTKYRFDPFDSTSLSQNFIYTIWEDKYGAIWVSSFEGMCKFDRSTEKFTRYKPSENAKFSDPNISVINEDSDGMIWVGSHSGGLCRFDRQTGKFLPEYFDLGYRQLPGDKAGLKDDVSCIYKDRAGTLWVGNTTGLHKIILPAAKAGQTSRVKIKAYRHDPANINTLSSNVVTSIIEDKIGIIWVATQNGLNSFDQKTGIVKRYLHDPNNIHSISSNNMQLWFGSHLKEDQEGNLWICTDKGLNKLNSDRTIFTAYFHNPSDAYSLGSNYIISLQIDKEGILWAGALSGKLNKANLNPKGFRLKRYDPNNLNSLSNNQVTSILEDSSGIIWIGTYGGGLNRWDKKNNQFTRFRNNPSNHKTLKNDAVHAILEDRHGHLWIANGDVLSQLNKQTGEFTHFYGNTGNYKDEDHRLIYSITEDREGLLWLGTGNGIKSFNKKTAEFIHYYHNPADSNGISDYTATTVFADSRDNIWVGHGSKATDKINKRTGKFAHFKHDPHDSGSISSNIVNSIYEDSGGNLWFGTFAGGLCYFDYQKEKFTTFTNRQGLPSNSVYSILEDNKNHLWSGTANGLSRFDPVTKTFTNYDYKDGLQSNVFAAGEERQRGAHFKGKDGTLYFGGTDGFNFFDPLQIKANRHIAPIVITQFKLFDKMEKGANELKEIVLDFDQNNFSFEFSSLSYSNPAKNQYAYKLEGVDKDWVYSGSRRYVAYTNIDPGTYTFKVKGTNNDGVWNEKGISISIIINPPWWKTWLFRIVAAFCLVASFYGLIRWRLKQKFRLQLERSEKEKQLANLRHKTAELEMQALRAQMNPHFIFNSLNSINRFILQNNKTQASEYLTKFSRLVRLILQNSQAALIPLESELESLQLYLELEAVRFDHHFEFKIKVEDELDISAIKLPPLIIQPYVENAIWHGLMHKEEKGHLNIELYREGNELCCKITDDGVGRKKASELKSKLASTHKSMGMQITADRIAILQQKKPADSYIKVADLVLADGSAGGTEVLLKIPIANV